MRRRDGGIPAPTSRPRGARSAAPEAAAAPARSERRFMGLRLREHVLVLRVADDSAALAVLVGDDELEAGDRRVDGDERDRAVVVLARGDRALPLAEVEDDVAALAASPSMSPSAAFG